MPGKDHEARAVSKTPWGSAQFEKLLKRVGIKPAGKAMALVMDIDFASRDKNPAQMVERCRKLALLRVTGSEDGAETPENKSIIDRLTMALMKEYDKIDRPFQAQMGTDDPKHWETVTNTADIAPPSGDFNAQIAKARLKMITMLEDGALEEAKSFGFKFAASSIKAGFWKKSERDLVLPMLKDAAAEVKKSKSSKAAAPAGKTEMVRGQNGFDLPAFVAQSQLFEGRAQHVRKCFDQQMGGALHKEIDNITQLVARAVDKEGFFLKVDQGGIMDFLFTADEQKQMKQWDDAPASEYEKDWADHDFGAESTDYYYDDSDSDSDGEDSADVNFGLADVNKVDMKQVASVYGFGEDEADLLHSFTREVVKKGADNAGVHKSAKDLLAQSKKKKNKPKVSNASYFAHAMMDAVRRAVRKKKVTKPMKKSEMAE